MLAVGLEPTPPDYKTGALPVAPSQQNTRLHSHLAPAVNGLVGCEGAGAGLRLVSTAVSGRLWTGMAHHVHQPAHCPQIVAQESSPAGGRYLASHHAPPSATRQTFALVRGHDLKAPASTRRVGYGWPGLYQ